MSATLIAATVAGSSRAAEPYTNYDTFTPAPPRVHRKRKEPSPSPPSSPDTMASVYRGESTLTLLHEPSTPSLSPEPPEPDEPHPGCWAGCIGWLKSWWSMPDSWLV